MDHSLVTSYQSKVIMDPGYKKTITPVPEFGNKNLMVNVSLRILDILRINEMKKTFTVKISLTREWMDRRLTYKNLKKENSKKKRLVKIGGGIHLVPIAGHKQH